MVLRLSANVNHTMPAKRLHIDQRLIEGDSLTLSDEQAHYLGRVLRARAGDALRVFDGRGSEHEARIDRLERRTVTVTIGRTAKANPEPPVAITLIQALSRNEKMDLVVQKAVELGAAAIRPVAVERSVMKLDTERGEKRRAHWHQIAVNAAQQCGRAVVPPVAAPMMLLDAVAETDPDLGLVADPDAAASLGTTLTATGEAPASVALVIGPEGGLTPEELEALSTAGYKGVKAGPRILRTETAGVALLAILQWQLGDLGRR